MFEMLDIIELMTKGCNCTIQGLFKGNDSISSKVITPLFTIQKMLFKEGFGYYYDWHNTHIISNCNVKIYNCNGYYFRIYNVIGKETCKSTDINIYANGSISVNVGEYKLKDDEIDELINAFRESIILSKIYREIPDLDDIKDTVRDIIYLQPKTRVAIGMRDDVIKKLQKKNEELEERAKLINKELQQVRKECDNKKSELEETIKQLRKQNDEEIKRVKKDIISKVNNFYFTGIFRKQQCISNYKELKKAVKKMIEQLQKGGVL